MGLRYQNIIAVDPYVSVTITNINCFQSILTACCPGSDIADGFGKSGVDNGEKGLKVIVLSMFVFAVAVTVALFIQIAAGARITNPYRSHICLVKL